MEIKNIVTTEEQSKRLDELGFKKESCFSYYRNGEIHPTLEGPYCLYPSYTASELMEYLPEFIGLSYLTINKIKGNYEVYYEVYYAIPSGGNEGFTVSTNLTHALGDILIYLLENKLINNE